VRLALAVAVFFAVAATWIVNDRSAAERVYDDESTANTSSDGLSLAYAYLQRQHGDVAMLTRPIGTARLAANSVVFKAGAAAPLRADEYDFMTNGGRIVLAVAGDLKPLAFRNDAAPCSVARSGAMTALR